ncbi:hypothetical protein AB0F46_42690 [Streptomyces sp. NPDC026665]|uniref:scabin-related ADP-ribosyltransferase n=1 Tax=Streptomyces sp. NPDC026665 TaxID=3154798 RepID=UPI0033DA73A0
MTQLPSAQVDSSVNFGNITGLPPMHEPVFRTTDEPLFRNDTRSPFDIFQNGFQPRKPRELNLTRASEHSIASGFVSTSTSPDLRFGPGDGFKFEIHAPGGIDVNKSQGDHIAMGGFGNENEISFPGGIRRENIAGARPLNRDGTATGDFIPNPYFNPKTPNPDVPGLLPYNPAPVPLPMAASLHPAPTSGVRAADPIVPKTKSDGTRIVHRKRR